MSNGYVRVLGPPQIDWDGRSYPLPFERRNQLVAYLALRRTWVGRAELAELLWPGQAPKLSNANLRKAVFRLQSLPWGSHLEAQGNALRFTVRTDLDDFEDGLRDGQAASGSAHADLLAGYEDGGEAWSQWLAFERERVRAAWRSAAVKWLQSDPADAAQAVALSARLLDADPGDEAALVQHMRWLARTGQPARARAAFEAFEARLASDFGLQPGAAARAALEGIAEAPREVPLPAADAGFVGRAVEVRQLEDWFATEGCRVAALVGAGGAGKTRLARHAMQRLAPHHRDGACFVALDDLEPGSDVVPRIARTLGIAGGGTPDVLSQVVKHLRERRLLLVLDNLEHLPGAAPVLAALLDACPQLNVLATSRTRPALAGVRVLPLEGLPCPDPEDEDRFEAFDAARLFVDTARRIDSRFDARVAARAIIDICRQLEGLPLALEIAAGWTRVLSCAAIAGELRHGTELLEAEDPARPARHASMQVVFAQSWSLLTSAEREALARLSVFRGGFTPESARTVTGAALPVLGALVDKSLLRRDGNRLQIHPLLQQFAAARLAAEPGGRERTEEAHALHFHRLLAQLAQPSSLGDRQALDEIDAELWNCRKAGAWSLAQGRADLVARSIPALRQFFDHRARWLEGLAMLRGALQSEHAGLERVRPLLLGVLAHLEYRLDRYADAIATATQAREAALADPDHEAELQSCKTLAVSSLRLGRFGDARHWFQEALRLAPHSADPRSAAGTLDNLALVEKSEGHMDEALRMSLAALAQFRAIRDVAGEALCLNNIAALQGDLGRVETGIAHLKEALALCERHNLASTLGLVLTNLTEQSIVTRDLPAARQYGQRALDVVRAAGNRALEAWLQVQHAKIEHQAGRLAEARAFLRSGLEQLVALGRPGLLVGALLALADLMEGGGQCEAADAVRRRALDEPGLSVLERGDIEARLGGREGPRSPLLARLTLAEIGSRAALETPVAYAALAAEAAAAPA